MTRPHRSGQGWNDRWFEGTRRGAVRGGYAATLSGAQRLSAERRRRDIFPAPPPAVLVSRVSTVLPGPRWSERAGRSEMGGHVDA